MPKRTTTRRTPARRTAVHEPWATRAGGWDALGDAHRRAAQASYNRWRKGRDDLAERFDRDDYVDYVQGQHAARRARDTDPDETSTAPALAAVRPDEPSARTDIRVSAHAVAGLSGIVPQAPGPGWTARRNGDVLNWRTPSGGSISDHGDRLVPDGRTDPADVIALARSKGWPGLRLTGPDEFRESVARAAALAEPPVSSDYCLSPAAARDVSNALAARAASRIAPTNPAAIRKQAEIDPSGAARRVLDDAEARARAALAGRPAGSTDPIAIGRPKLADLLDRREAAREAAQEAQEAAARHRGEHGVLSRLLDPAARRRQSALDDEAQRADKDFRRLDRGQDRAVSRVEKDSAKAAKTNRGLLDDWRYQPDVRRAERQMVGLAEVRAALDGESPAVIAALGSGDVRQAVAASTKWRDEAPERARQAEREAEQERRRDETVRETAVRLAADAERYAVDDPDALMEARTTTAAASAEDPATMAALLAGDPEEAAEAAARWQQQERRAVREQVPELADGLAGPGGP